MYASHVACCLPLVSHGQTDRDGRLTVTLSSPAMPTPANYSVSVLSCSFSAPAAAVLIHRGHLLLLLSPKAHTQVAGNQWRYLTDERTVGRE